MLAWFILEKIDHSYQIASPVSIQVQFVYLLIFPDTSASLNEYFTSSKSNEFVLTLFVDEFSSHASVVNIETKAPKLDFYFHQLVWPEFLKSFLI